MSENLLLGSLCSLILWTLEEHQKLWALLQTLFFHVLVTSHVFVMLEVHLKTRLFLSLPCCAPTPPAASMGWHVSTTLVSCTEVELWSHIPPPRSYSEQSAVSSWVSHMDRKWVRQIDKTMLTAAPESSSSVQFMRNCHDRRKHCWNFLAQCILT